MFLWHFTLSVCPKLPQMCLRRCSWRVEFLQPGSRCVLLIWTVLVHFQSPPWKDGVFAQRGLDRDKPLKLKQLLNSQFIGFHNKRGLRKKGVRVSRLDDWTEMSSSLQCKLMYIDGPILGSWIYFGMTGGLTDVWQNLQSPCWFLTVTCVAGFSKSDCEWQCIKTGKQASRDDS